MKLHELKPAPGSRKARTRVGRGIAAGKGKTAGRGTKGQKSRSGGKVPPWFEGGQTPIHVRVPKLRGFKQRDRIDYQVVNVGRIAEYATAGRFGETPGKDPLTVNAEILSGAGLVTRPDRPVKVLGGGDIDIKLFVAADRFTASAVKKIEAAGGYVQVLAPPPEPQPAVEEEADIEAAETGTEAETADGSTPDAAEEGDEPPAADAAEPPAADADQPADGADQSAAADGDDANSAADDETQDAG